MVTGSAGPMGVQNAAPQLQRCSNPIATLALAEGQFGSLAQYGATSPLPLLRLLAQQSGCFLVVDRAEGLGLATQEVELAESGMIRRGSGVGRGQLVAADYTATPSVVFKEDNSAQYGAALLGLIPLPGAALASGIIGSLRFKEAQVTLFLVDNRSGVQVAAVEGSASKGDIGLGAGVLGLALPGLGGIGGYGARNTNEDKVVAAAALDAFNKLVFQVQSLPPSPTLISAVKPAAEEEESMADKTSRPLHETRKCSETGYVYLLK